MGSFFRYHLILLLSLFFVSLLYAGTTGKIVGTVRDSKTGEPLIGANVVLEGTQMGISTDQDGYFVLINVPPGVYTLTVHYIGYASASIENVRVRVDRTTTQNVQLSPT
ncbi:MAG: carboxypeptidase-like regulatory domain-containing protein, partial [Calditrichaeota bacterium]